MNLRDMSKEELELLKVEVKNNSRAIKTSKKQKFKRNVVYYDRFATQFIPDSDVKVIATTHEKLF